MKNILYKCERCGTNVINKYGSGRFCSKKCACSHIQTEMQNKSRREKLEKFKIVNCLICGKPFKITSWKTRKTCSDACKKVIYSINGKKAVSGGDRINSGKSKCGYYKGIYCGSTYELAFLVYCLDNNIKIERNEDYFLYTHNGETHKYFPDFKINNKTYIEIKGVHSEIVDIKLKCVDKPIQILFKNDLKTCFDHLVNNYGLKYNKANNNFYLLYDK